jgi:hypothetical protein
MNILRVQNSKMAQTKLKDKNKVVNISTTQKIFNATSKKREYVF